MASPLSMNNVSMYNEMDIENYIVGGRYARNGEVPYQVSLQRLYFHYCGGSIISKRYILTAAHCVDRVEAKSVVIRYNTLRHDKGGSLMRVSKLIPHGEYDSYFIKNDIALIKTKSRLRLGRKNAKKVKLPRKNSEPRGKVLVSGWGLESENGTEVSDRLKVVRVPVVSRKKCKEAYGDILTKNMFCAGVLKKGGKDSCQGDSGGPAVNRVKRLVGIVSFGKGCAKPDYPGVYTKVSKYINWIKKHSDVK